MSEWRADRAGGCLPFLVWYVGSVAESPLTSRSLADPKVMDLTVRDVMDQRFPRGRRGGTGGVRSQNVTSVDLRAHLIGAVLPVPCKPARHAVAFSRRKTTSA